MEIHYSLFTFFLNFFIVLIIGKKSDLIVFLNLFHSSERVSVFQTLSALIQLIIPASLIQKTIKLKNGSKKIKYQFEQ